MTGKFVIAVERRLEPQFQPLELVGPLSLWVTKGPKF
jgi:hypothetical protein